MEEYLKKELGEDENLLWSGRPEPFETLDQTNKKPVIVKAIVAGIAVTALCLAYILYAGRSGVGVKIGLPVVTVLIGIFAAVRPLMDAAKVRKSVMYAMTDKRIFVIIGDSVKSLEYSSINVARFRTDEDGHSALLCGEKGVTMKPSAWRAAVLSGVCTDEKTGLCDSFVLYAIPDAGKVKDLLKVYLPV